MKEPIITKTYFKAFIRVVKSIRDNNGWLDFTDRDIIKERFIEAESRDDVKKYLLAKYPQFFQNGKIYTKETKDEAQFFYVIIYPLYEYEKQQIEEGAWTCSYCGHVHENKYVSRPVSNDRLLGSDKFFCMSGEKHRESICLDKYLESHYKKLGIDMPDDTNYVKADSPNYIYKITEKSTGKSYIGKTKNAPFFRWWNHLTHSSSPFGLYLRATKLSDWTFEVLAELPYNIENSDILRIESEYIVKYDSINNGFNTVISNKSALVKEDVNQTEIDFTE